MYVKFILSRESREVIFESSSAQVTYIKVDLKEANRSIKKSQIIKEIFYRLHRKGTISTTK